jgi:NAD(P)-dependent dehydrogenase (short-subunit alcohol dehydrogenase family)
LNVLEWEDDDLIGNFEVNMLGYIRMLKLLAPDMVAAGGGTIICTGNTAAHRGKANFGSFASTKSGQFVLCESAARHLMPKGVHVCYLTIDAAIAGTPPARAAVKAGKSADFFIQPVAIAYECFHLSQQDKSAWTFDHWIRPFGETW